jgi:excisionase family DNA binding protein
MRRTAQHDGESTMKSENSPYEVLNTKDVARIMKCSARKIQRLVVRGELPMKPFGSQYVITRKRLEEYLDK